MIKNKLSTIKISFSERQIFHRFLSKAQQNQLFLLQFIIVTIKLAIKCLKISLYLGMAQKCLE